MGGTVGPVRPMASAGLMNANALQPLACKERALSAPQKHRPLHCTGRCIKINNDTVTGYSVRESRHAKTAKAFNMKQAVSRFLVKFIIIGVCVCGRLWERLNTGSSRG